MQRLIIAMIAALGMTGCVTRTVYVYPEIAIPPAPVLPTIAAADLECLGDDAYEALAVRDRLRRGYSEQLRAIIEEHNRRE